MVPAQTTARGKFLQWCFRGFVLVVVWLLCNGHTTIADETKKEFDAFRKAKLDAARKTYELILKQKYGLTNTNSKGQIDIDHVVRWSRNWLDAERDLSARKEDHLVAHQAHLKRMKALQEQVRTVLKAGLGSPTDASAMDYYLAEAELWLAMEKAK
jgi:hypothetical protein